MRTVRPFALIVALLLAAAGLSLASCGSGGGEGGGMVGDMGALQTALEVDGFTVQEGKLETFDVIAMYNAGIVPSCYGNNAQAPYMCCKLPEAPGQEATNTVSDAPIKPENRGLWADYRLRPDEAVVFIGKTPPQCSYFSYCSYIALRYFPEEGQARRVFGSLGDSLNNMVTATEGTPGGAGGDVYEQYTVIICTADRGIDQRVRDALKAAGYSMDIVNTDVIPSGLVKMGLGEESDTFTFIHRLAFFNDEQAGEAYMGSAQGTVLRLTPQDGTQLNPFEVPEMRVRGTGDTSELDLQGALEELRQAILERYPDLQARRLETGIWELQGYDAIQRGTDALGDNNDAVYLRSDQFTLGRRPPGVRHRLRREPFRDRKDHVQQLMRLRSGYPQRRSRKGEQHPRGDSRGVPSGKPRRSISLRLQGGARPRGGRELPCHAHGPRRLWDPSRRSGPGSLPPLPGGSDQDRAVLVVSII